MVQALTINPYNYKNEYADTDLSNVSNAGKEFITAQIVPNYTKGKKGQTIPNVWKTIDRDCLVIAYYRATSNTTDGSIVLRDENSTPVPGKFNGADNSGVAAYIRQWGSGAAFVISAIVPKNYSYKCAAQNAVFDGVYEYPLKGVSI